MKNIACLYGTIGSLLLMSTSVMAQPGAQKFPVEPQPTQPQGQQPHPQESRPLEGAPLTPPPPPLESAPIRDWILCYGERIDREESSLNTALRRNQPMEVLEWLVRKGAQVDLGNSSLNTALQADQSLKILQWIRALRAQPDFKGDSSLNVALQSRQQIKILKWLVTQGARVDCNGISSLNSALQADQPLETLLWLVDQGAKEDLGWSSLNVALRAGRSIEILRWLRGRGARVDFSGRASISAALAGGQPIQVLEWLLQEGACLSALKMSHIFPEAVREIRGNNWVLARLVSNPIEVLNLLLRHGATFGNFQGTIPLRRIEALLNLSGDLRPHPTILQFVRDSIATLPEVSRATVARWLEAAEERRPSGSWTKPALRSLRVPLHGVALEGHAPTVGEGLSGLGIGTPGSEDSSGEELLRMDTATTIAESESQDSHEPQEEGPTDSEKEEDDDEVEETPGAFRCLFPLELDIEDFQDSRENHTVYPYDLHKRQG